MGTLHESRRAPQGMAAARRSEETSMEPRSALPTLGVRPPARRGAGSGWEGRVIRYAARRHASSNGLRTIAATHPATAGRDEINLAYRTEVYRCRKR